MSDSLARELEPVRKIVSAAGRSLHPLALRLPLPPKEEISAIRKALKKRWIGTLIWTDDGQLLDGRVRLWIWLQLGHTIEEVPSSDQRTVPAVNALPEYLTGNLGTRLEEHGWTRWRRAAAASVFAPDAHDSLDQLRRWYKCDDNQRLYYHSALARLCQTADRYVSYAVRLRTRSDISRFLSALAGRQSYPDVAYIQTAVEHGSRKLAAGSSTIQFKQFWKRFPRSQQIDLFLIDLAHSPLPIRLHEITNWYRPTTHIALLCDLDDLLNPEGLRQKMHKCLEGSLRDGTQPLDIFTFRYVARALAEVRAQEHTTRRVALWRTVVVFSPDAKTLPTGSYRETLKGDLSSPRSQDECRELIYLRLMRAFCHRNRRNVFVPYTRDLRGTLQSSDHDRTLAMLERAAGRAGVELVCFGFRDNSFLGEEQAGRYLRKPKTLENGNVFPFLNDYQQNSSE